MFLENVFHFSKTFHGLMKIKIISCSDLQARKELSWGKRCWSRWWEFLFERLKPAFVQSLAIFPMHIIYRYYLAALVTNFWILILSLDEQVSQSKLNLNLAWWTLTRCSGRWSGQSLKDNFFQNFISLVAPLTIVIWLALKCYVVSLVIAVRDEIFPWSKCLNV